MKKTHPIEKSSSSFLLSLVLFVFILQVAQEIFIPIALAILLSFVLNPLIVRLCAWKLPRMLAIIITVFFSFFLMGLLGWLVSYQVVRLAQNIPHYERNVQTKLHEFSKIPKHLYAQFYEMTTHFKNETLPASTLSNKKQQVIVESAAEGSLLTLPLTLIKPIISPLVTGLLTIIFLLYMLVQREDLRERFILLISQGDFNLATQAIDDATRRISQYLIMNLSINTVFGIAIGIGLYFIGVPNAFLWGLLSTLLRFIPYLGIWIAASFPFIIAFSIDPGWSMLLMTISLFACIELATNYFLEPKLYGATTNISSIAVMLASVFWTWLWGVVGLFLSVPITVCLFVIGKYVAGFEFLETLLGSEPVLNPYTLLYQRFLAMDKVEILKISKQYLKRNSLAQYYDYLLIPALSMAKKDQFKGALAENRQNFILEDTLELMDKNKNQIKNSIASTSPNVICIAARDEFDELTGGMLAQILAQNKMVVKVIECVALREDMLNYLCAHENAIICISSLPPYALSPARHLYKSIKKVLPSAKIVVGIWNASTSISHLHTGWESAVVVTSLTEAAFQIKQWLDGNKKPSPPIKKPLRQIKLEKSFEHIPVSELYAVIIKTLAKKFDVPISLVSLLKTDKHFWKSHTSLFSFADEDQDYLIQTSVCEHIINKNETLVVPDLGKDAHFSNNTELQERGVLFFAGTPLKADKQVVGILCVLDTKPHEIKTSKVVLLETFANILMQKILD